MLIEPGIIFIAYFEITSVYHDIPCDPLYALSTDIRNDLYKVPVIQGGITKTFNQQIPMKYTVFQSTSCVKLRRPAVIEA